MLDITPSAVKKAFETLELPPFVTREDIKKHYRFLAKKYHPDRGGDAKRFRDITEAYRIVTDYIERFRFTFDDEEINRQLSGAHYDERFTL